MNSRLSLALTAMLSFAFSAYAQDASSKMTFFITSVGEGHGADLGGLAGADRHCQDLAKAVGAGNRTWRAYLSAGASDGKPAVNARDRIGKGPWYNAKGVEVAKSVDDLHSDRNLLTKQNSISEKGEVLNGRGDNPNQHDMLTGSQPDGSFIAGDVNSTCSNWQHGEGGAAMVGHSDRTGLDETVPAKSWNSSHQSRGCSPEQLKTTGGAGQFYCFAAD